MPFSKIHLFFLLPLLLLVEPACKNKNNRSEDATAAIESYPSYKNLNDSIHEFPADASLYLRRATRLSQENAHELANADFQKAWSLRPQLDIGFPYAANLAILGRRQERLKLLDSMIHQYPSNPQVCRLLAETYSSDGRPERALVIYNDMLSRDSLDPETYYEKALLLEQLKDTAQAIRSLQKAYSFGGVDTYGLELAHLYAEQKNQKALEICNFILRQDSAQVLIDPLFIKGIYYANVKLYPKAIAQFDSCIARDWKTTDAYLEKGRVYFHLGNFNAAAQTFTMAITVTNTDPDAYYWLGRCYEAQHRMSDAISNYKKAVSLDKNFTEARQRIETLNHGFADPSH